MTTAAFLLAFMALQNPVPGARESNAAPHQNPQTEQRKTENRPEDVRGTQPSPVIVQVLPIAKSPEQTKDDQDRRDREATSDRWNRVLTGMLALATIGLGVIGYYQWRALKRHARHFHALADATKKAADAATHSADTAAGILTISRHAERAQVGVAYSDWQMGQDPNAAFGDASFFIGYNLTNSGRTPAVISHIAIVGDRLPPQETPRPIVVSDETPEWRGEAIVAAGQSIPQRWEIPAALYNQEEWDKLWTGRLLYWLQGRVSYWDVFGDRHYTNFTARLHLPSKTFSFVLMNGYSDGN